MSDVAAERESRTAIASRATVDQPAARGSERPAGVPTEYLPEAPPVGEEIHLPGPTLIPLLSAIGITLTVVGTTINWIFSAVGVLIVLLTTIRWIRDTRKDVAELPDQHR